MNKVIFVGRICSDITTSYSSGKEPVARSLFGLAIPDMSMSRDKEGNYPTDFFQCVCFGKISENVEKYCEKGNKLLIEGRVKNNNYQKDGTTIYSTEIIVDSLEFLETKKSTTDKKKK